MRAWIAVTCALCCALITGCADNRSYTLSEDSRLERVRQHDLDPRGYESIDGGAVVLWASSKLTFAHRLESWRCEDCPWGIELMVRFKELTERATCVVPESCDAVMFIMPASSRPMSYVGVEGELRFTLEGESAISVEGSTLRFISPVGGSVHQTLTVPGLVFEKSEEVSVRLAQLQEFGHGSWGEGWLPETE